MAENPFSSFRSILARPPWAMMVLRAWWWLRPDACAGMEPPHRFAALPLPISGFSPASC